MTRFMKFAILGAALAVPATSAFADTITFTGQTAGTFNGGSTTQLGQGESSTDPGKGLTYNGSTFTGSTSNSGFVSFGGDAAPGANTANFGSFTLTSTEADYSNDSFKLKILFSAPTGIGTGQTQSYSATLMGTISPGTTGGVQINFAGPQTFTFTNPDQSGTFTLTVNNVAVNPGKTASVTGYITASTIAATPEPSSLMLLGTGLLSAAGVAIRKRSLV